MLNLKQKIMKKVFMIMMTLLTLSISSQDKGEDFLTYGIITAPGTYIDFGHEGFSDDGGNLGFQFTYSSNIPYVGLELFAFPKLNGYNYTHLIMRAGINQDFKILNKYWLNFNTRLGVRIGGVVRENGATVYGTSGWEIGFDYRLPIHITYNSFLSLSFNFSQDTRTDGKAFDPDLDKFKVNSIWLGFNYTHVF